MKNWLIHKLGGYTALDRRGYLDDWFYKRLRYQLSRKRRRTIDVYESDMGIYKVKVKFIK